MRRILAAAALAAAVTLAACALPAAAATYYVSPSGSDGATGTSQGAAWRTVGKVNATSLQPGDSVLFQGGATFADATLMPRTSGASGAPITFASYGDGRATIANANGAVWFSGKSWLTFSNLRLTTSGATNNVFGGSSGGGSGNIVLENSVVTGSGGPGVIAPTAADHDWTITGTTVTGVGDSGLIMLGSGHSITHNTISNVGGNAAITYGKHGIYSKGPNQTIAYNDISGDVNGQGISIRFHGARVYGNTIHDTASAIAFFDYDEAAAPQGTSYVYGNRAWNITNYAFYYAGQLDPNGHAPSVDFVLASNTFQLANAAEAVDVGPSGSAHVTLVNNVFFGSYRDALLKAATTVEHHNVWSGAGANIPSGTGDLRVAPGLTAAPELAPNPGSPVVDAGTASGTGLSYGGSCDGTPLAFCGSSPDIGAVETAVVPAVPLATPTALVATGATGTSITLTWSGGDPRTSGYEVLRNGAVVATTVLPTATVTGLTCGTSYSLGVRATGSAATSATATTTASTAACSAPPTTTTTTTTPTPTTTIGGYTTPAPKPKGPRKLRTLQTVPQSGSVVRSRFLVAATPPQRVTAVTFLLDGRSACVDRSAPYTCALKARPGWHTVRIRPLGAAATSVRLRVR